MYNLKATLIGNKLKFLTAIHIIFIRVICYHAAVEVTEKKRYIHFLRTI